MRFTLREKSSQGVGSDDNYSNLRGSITVTLSGLTLQRASGGLGGKVISFEMNDLGGLMTVPIINGFSMAGVYANLTVTDYIHGTLEIHGSVVATVSIADFFGAGIVEIGSGGPFDGTLDLLNGIPALGKVSFISDPFGDGKVDLNGKPVAGLLEFLDSSDVSIVNGGAVTGEVILASGSGDAFSGNATFERVSTGGVIKTANGADLEGNIFSTFNVTGDIDIAGAASGDITIGTLVSGNVVVGQALTGDIDIGGAVSGTVDVGQDVSGDISIGGDIDSGGSVTIGGALASLVTAGIGRVMVTGSCDGALAVAEQTDRLTLIHCLGGLGSDGTIEVNTSTGNLDAGGTIHVGPVTYFSLPDITFDGCIHIYNDGAGSGGALTGAITVVGCHDLPLEDLNICIDGDDNGNVTIEQDNCSYPVDWDCDTCPTP